MNDIDPLAKLVVSDSKEVDRQKLSDLLEWYVFFDQTDQKMNFKDKFYELGRNTDKLELILLADKARALYFPDRTEGVSQSDVLAVQAMPEGSVKSSLKTLFDSRKILKNNDGKYYIPAYRLTELFSKFKDGGKNG